MTVGSVAQNFKTAVHITEILQKYILTQMILRITGDLGTITSNNNCYKQD